LQPSRAGADHQIVHGPVYATVPGSVHRYVRSPDSPTAVRSSSLRSAAITANVRSFGSTTFLAVAAQGRDQLVGGDVRVELAGGDALGQPRQGLAAVPVAEVAKAFAKLADGDGLDLRLGAAVRGPVQLPGGAHPAVVLLDRGHDVVDALAAGGHGLGDRRAPDRAGHLAAAERDHVLEVAHGLLGAVAVGLVDH